MSFPQENRVSKRALATVWKYACVSLTYLRGLVDLLNLRRLYFRVEAERDKYNKAERSTSHPEQRWVGVVVNQKSRRQ